MTTIEIIWTVFMCVAMLAIIWMFLDENYVFEKISAYLKRRKDTKRLKKYANTYSGRSFWERIPQGDWVNIASCKRPFIICKNSSEYKVGDRIHLQACFFADRNTIKDMTGYFCTIQLKAAFDLSRAFEDLSGYSAFTFDIIGMNI